MALGDTEIVGLLELATRDCGAGFGIAVGGMSTNEGCCCVLCRVRFC